MNCMAEKEFDEDQLMLEGKLMYFKSDKWVASAAALNDKLMDLNQERERVRRMEILKTIVGSIGENSTISSPFRCDRGYFIVIGNNTSIGPNCYILEGGPVTIGDRVVIGPNVSLIGATHSTDPVVRNAGTAYGKPVTIKDGAVIEAGAIVLPGVTVGENAVVGARSVVTRDVLDNTVVFGNPARVVREVSLPTDQIPESRGVPE